MQRPGADLGENPLSGNIPSQMAYGRDTYPGLKSHKVLTNFAAENNGTYSPTGLNVVRIPVRSVGSFLDLKEAQLSFNLSLTGTSTQTFLDGGAQCIIDRLRVLTLAGQQLECIESYNLIACIVDQYTEDLPRSYDVAVRSGAPGSPYVWPSDSPYLYGTIGYNQNTGPVFDTSAPATIVRHYEIKLRAGWFNPDLGKYLPPDTPFVLELTLAQAADSLVASTRSVVVNATSCVTTAQTADYTATQFFLKIPTITVNDVNFMDRVRMLKNIGTEWSATTYKHYITSIATANAQNVMLDLAIRCKSLTGLVGVMRSQTTKSLLVGTGGTGISVQLGVHNPNGWKLSKRTIQYLSSYYATIGNDNYPPTQINIVTDGTSGGGTVGVVINQSDPNGPYLLSKQTPEPWQKATSTGVNIAEVWCQAKAVFGKSGMIDPVSFGNSEHISQNGAGVFCIDVESFHGDKRTTSGINTYDMVVPVKLVVSLSPATITGTTNLTGTSVDVVIVPIQVDVFAQCDIKFALTSDGGIVSLA